MSIHTWIRCQSTFSSSSNTDQQVDDSVNAPSEVKKRILEKYSNIVVYKGKYTLSRKMSFVSRSSTLCLLVLCINSVQRELQLKSQNELCCLFLPFHIVFAGSMRESRSPHVFTVLHYVNMSREYGIVEALLILSMTSYFWYHLVHRWQHVFEPNECSNYCGVVTETRYARI